MNIAETTEEKTYELVPKGTETSVNVVTGDGEHLITRLREAMKKAVKIDIIVAFMMESGVKLLSDELKEAVSRKVPMRVLTGNYLNITQPQALYLLKDMLGDAVDLRFYNQKNRSFHPKAYIFHYKDGGEIFVGSSNVSRSALTSGIEWNYKLSKEASPMDFEHFCSTFEDLFLNHSIIVDEQELRRYSASWVRPKVYKDMEAIEDAGSDKNKVIQLYEPRGAQLEALYELKKAREEGLDKGIVVAATGIGKTFLAAFDSREFNKVLFVAHREEIVRQACETFKKVMPEKSAGFFMSNQKDTDVDMLFATVQSLGKKEYLDPEHFERECFDYVVMDEFHHAAAGNYGNIIEYFNPKFFLGLTATPERLDNKDVFALCDYNLVYEVRLREAINKGWLVPFRYYGIFDESVNYDDIQFKNGKYDEQQLEKALMIGRRAELVLNHYKKYRSDRALGFCTSRKHAEQMAAFFCENGVEACAVYSGALGEYSMERNEALEKLRTGEMKVIFSVDMFNEGLDVPSVDLVMFLRPTESPTVFLQQLGRGLRKSKEKKYLNVLDFIGNYKNATLIPFLLSGRKYQRKVKGVTRTIHEEDYPEDCLVDFDFRLVDIFEKQEKEERNLTQMISEEFFRIKEDLQHRPSRLEMFTYMDDDIYEIMQNKIKSNIFNDYLRFLKVIGELSKEECNLIGTKAHEFIKLVENTDMKKSYKMPVLLAFYNNGSLKLEITDDDFYESFKDFYSRGSNGADMLKGKETKNFRSWGKREYVNLAKKAPVRYLAKNSSDFFKIRENDFCLTEELAPFAENQAFMRHFKDAIDYKTRKHYKNKLEEKYKKDAVQIKMALRDEKVNIFSLMQGKQLFVCKRKKINEKNKMFILDCKKSDSIFALSDEGKNFVNEIQEETFKLKHVAFLEDQIEIKVDRKVLEKICTEEFFPMWRLEGPIKYFEGYDVGYLVIFRVYEIRDEVTDELLQKGRSGRNSIFGLTEEFETELVRPVLTDKEFKEQKEKLISILMEDDYIINETEKGDE